MARNIETDRNKILDAVIAIIEEKGFGAVSARTVAKRLNISTQPIYREFGDMDGLRAAAAKRGFEIFTEYVNGDALFQSVRYVMFAAEHAGLFDFLFRGKLYGYGSLDELSHSLVEGTEIISRLEAITKLPREKVYRLHLFVWMALHGLATFSADNGFKLGEGEITEFTKEMTRALSAFYKEGGV